MWLKILLNHTTIITELIPCIASSAQACACLSKIQVYPLLVTMGFKGYTKGMGRNYANNHYNGKWEHQNHARGQQHGAPRVQVGGWQRRVPLIRLNNTDPNYQYDQSPIPGFFQPMPKHGGKGKGNGKWKSKSSSTWSTPNSSGAKGSGKIPSKTLTKDRPLRRPRTPPQPVPHQPVAQSLISQKTGLKVIETSNTRTLMGKKFMKGINSRKNKRFDAKEMTPIPSSSKKQEEPKPDTQFSSPIMKKAKAEIAEEPDNAEAVSMEVDQGLPKSLPKEDAAIQAKLDTTLEELLETTQPKGNTKKVRMRPGKRQRQTDALQNTHQKLLVEKLEEAREMALAGKSVDVNSLVEEISSIEKEKKEKPFRKIRYPKILKTILKEPRKLLSRHDQSEIVKAMNFIYEMTNNKDDYEGRICREDARDLASIILENVGESGSEEES